MRGHWIPTQVSWFQWGILFTCEQSPQKSMVIVDWQRANKSFSSVYPPPETRRLDDAGFYRPKWNFVLNLINYHCQPYGKVTMGWCDTLAHPQECQPNQQALYHTAHRKLKETKQQPSMLPGPAVPGGCLVSLHILWAILRPHPVQSSVKTFLPFLPGFGNRWLKYCFAVYFWGEEWNIFRMFLRT